MSRATLGGSRIPTKPTRNVPGGMADVSLARFDQFMGHARPVWADDPNRILPCQEDGVDPDTFHPVSSGEAAHWAELRAAEYCERCPFGPRGGIQRDGCLEHGLANNESGIWGGRKLDGMRPRAKTALLAKIRKRRGAA